MKYLSPNLSTSYCFYSVVFLSLILNRQGSLVSASDDDDENIDPRKDPMLGSQFADNVKAYLYVAGNEDPKEFSWKDSAKLSSVGFKKGERYRFLFHDWCGSKSDMLPLAIAYQQSSPKQNIILIDFSNPKPATFDEMKSLVKNYAVQSLYFLYGIFDAIDVSESATDVRSKSHAIGFGFGALIASWFGAAAGQSSRNLVKQLGYPFKSDGGPYVFSLPRLTSIDPVGMCIYTEEKNSPACAGVTKWNKISQSKAHAKFTDAMYTSKASIPTICPAEAGSRRIAHHRGVYFNEGLGGDLAVAFLQPGCSAESFSSTKTLCADLAASCSHGRGISLYADVIFILGLFHIGCDQVVGPMFGDRNPNTNEEGALATNFHVESDSIHPFSRSLQCFELGGDHPDYDSRYPECEQLHVQIQHISQWEVKSGSGYGATGKPKTPDEMDADINWENNKKIKKQSNTEISKEQGNKNKKPGAGPNEGDLDVDWENKKDNNQQSKTEITKEQGNKNKKPSGPNEADLEANWENKKDNKKQSKTEMTKEQGNNNKKPGAGPNEADLEANWENKKDNNKQSKTEITKEQGNKNKKPGGPNEADLEANWENKKDKNQQSKTEITKEQGNKNKKPGAGPNEIDIDADRENNKNKNKQTNTQITNEETNKMNKPKGPNENEMDLDVDWENKKNKSKQTKTEITNEHPNKNQNKPNNGPNENEMDLDFDWENNKNKSKQQQTVVETETNGANPYLRPVRGGGGSQNNGDVHTYQGDKAQIIARQDQNDGVNLGGGGGGDGTGGGGKDGDYYRPQSYQSAKAETINSEHGTAKKTRNQKLDTLSQLETFDGGFRKEDKRDELSASASAAVEFQRTNKRGRRNVAEKKRFHVKK